MGPDDQDTKDNQQVDEIKKMTAVNLDESLPLKAKNGGFFTGEEWNIAQKEDIDNKFDFDNWSMLKKAGISKEDWLRMRKAGFTDYDQWTEAENYGFDNKGDWDDWLDLQKSGFNDLDLFYEIKRIKLMDS